jgi:hypothetical protein
MAKRPPKIKIMVASSIYGFEDQLDQICATLAGYGYEVLSSYLKTIPVDPNRSNLENCLNAVGLCDVFLGIIRPQYGSGVIGDFSITHQEMRKAIELKKPRWFIAHRDIPIARQLLRQYMFDIDGNPNPDFTYRRTNVMDDIRLIKLYNETILNDVPPEERIGHWVDEYFRLSDILKCIETQFSNIPRVREIVEKMAE